jgi:hypothetical protein
VFLALVLYFVFAVVLVSGWALALWAADKGLALPEGGRDAWRLPGTVGCAATRHGSDAIPSAKRAA